VKGAHGATLRRQLQHTKAGNEDFSIVVTFPDHATDGTVASKGKDGHVLLVFTAELAELVQCVFDNDHIFTPQITAQDAKHRMRGEVPCFFFAHWEFFKSDT
jgi:hypothetical protein